MITSAIIDYCKCHLIPADKCPHHPPKELTYEVEVYLKEVVQHVGGTGCTARNT